MSKQSRAKARARRKSQGTGAAVAFAQTIRHMPEADRFYTKSVILDELHKVLSDRRTFDNSILGLFYCELWTDIEDAVMSKRDSKNRAKALELIAKVKMFYGYYK
jgi:hypothetical protein